MAEIKQTSLPGVLEIFPRVFPDSRGYFFESFRQDWLDKMGVHESWVQDNQSFSQKGTVRGIHFQQGEHAQAKLVRVIAGKVLDVAVDLRKGSSTFGQVYSTILDAEKNNKRSHSPFKNFESIWASLEIFNLIDRPNTISYLLVKDFQNNLFTMPNRLTPRLVNLKLVAKW